MKQTSGVHIHQGGVPKHDLAHDMYAPEKRANKGRGLIKLSRRWSGPLSPSETRIVELVSSGYSDKEVAARTPYTEKSVKQLLHRAYQKMNIDHSWGNARVRLTLQFIRRDEEPAGDIPLTPLDTPQRVA